MRKQSLCVVVWTIGMASTWSNAGIVEATHPYNLYGHIWNSDKGTNADKDKTAEWEGWCAPTSTANSFIYLENRGVDLTPGKMTQLQMRDKLVLGWTGPDEVFHWGMGPLGADEKSWWEAKANWIDDYAPGILLGGTTTVDATLWYDGAKLSRGVPVWNYLWDQIDHCDDVEILIDSGSLYRHAVTLTGMRFDDMDGDRNWDIGENRWIIYIDPNNPDGINRINPPPDAQTGPFLAQINDVLGLDGLPTGQLMFRWDNLGYNPPVDVKITLAYTERIPEPTAAATLIALLAARALLHRPISSSIRGNG